MALQMSCMVPKFGVEVSPGCSGFVGSGSPLEGKVTVLDKAVALVVVWIGVDRMLAMDGVTAMGLMESRYIRGGGQSVGQAFGKGAMTGVSCLWGSRCRQRLVLGVGLAPYSVLAIK